MDKETPYATPKADCEVGKKPATFAMAVSADVFLAGWFLGLVAHKLLHGIQMWMFVAVNVFPFVAAALAFFAMRSSRKSGVDVSVLAVPVLALSVVILPIAAFLLYLVFRRF